MLKAENITYRKNGHVILQEIDCGLEPGKINLILGPNGAGKSTLLRIMAGQIQPDKGAVHYGSEKLTDISLGELAKKRSVLSQSVDIAFQLNVSEVVMMGRYPHFKTQPLRRDQKICDEAMDFFGVGGLARRQYLSLSGGEKQRVQFARVLAQVWKEENQAGRYLFLDEPLTFLDIHYQLDFMEKIKTLLSDDLTIVGVVHDLNLAARYADWLLLLCEGKIFAKGTAKNVLAPSNIKAVYHVQSSVYQSDERFHLLF